MKYKVLYTLYFDDVKDYSCKVDSLEDALDLVSSLMFTYTDLFIDISVWRFYNGSWLRIWNIESDYDDEEEYL